MTEYNTGNELGSTDPRDLYDNSQNFDFFSLGPADEYPDRKGKMRSSLTGYENRFQAALRKMGYVVVGAYAAGLVITEYNQVFIKDGEYYRAGPNLTLPYTTTGNWAVESPKFVTAGDNVLRQGLADPAVGLGADLVAYTPGQTVGDRLDELSGGVGGQIVGMSQTGAGAIYDTALAEYRRIIRPEQFGAVGDGIADDTLALQRALDRGVGQLVTLRPGAIYGISAALQIDSGTTLVAYGAQIKRLAFIDNMIRNKSNGTVGGWSANTNITLLGGHWRSDDAFGQQLTLIGFSHCTGIILRDVQTTHNGPWHHVELNSTRQALVENCVFNGGYAANLATNEAVQIDANIDGSQWPWFGPSDSTQCYEITIRGCTFNSNGTGIGTHSGVANMRHSNILIEGNTFVKPLYVGVHARSWSGVKIVDNRFEGGYWGVYHEYNDSNVTNDWLIEGNTFFQQGDTDWPGGDGRAIVIDGTASTYLRNYRIVNNAVLSINLASKSRHGISVNYTHQGVISGNTLDSINRTGIYVYGGDRINVNNNMLINCNQEGLTGAVAGIVLGNTGGVDTNRLTVVGNTTDTLYMTGTIRSVVRQNQVTTASGLTQAGTNTNANVGNNLVDTTFT